MIRKYPIFLLMLLVLLAGACSTTEKISDGEQLYVGIKSTKYHRETGDAKDKTTIQAFNTAKEEVPHWPMPPMARCSAVPPSRNR